MRKIEKNVLFSYFLGQNPASIGYREYLQREKSFVMKFTTRIGYNRKMHNSGSKIAINKKKSSEKRCFCIIFSTTKNNPWTFIFGQQKLPSILK